MSYRRDNLRTSKEAKNRQEIASINRVSSPLKCRVTAVFLPGDETPFDDDFSVNQEEWSVALELLDNTADSFRFEIESHSFPVDRPAEELAISYGSHDLVGQVVELYFSNNQVKATGKVRISTQSRGKHKGSSKKYSLKGKSIDLSLASLLP